MRDILARKNRRLMAALLAVVAVMVGGSYAAVPLYRIFCQVTGFGGTTNVAERPSGEVSARVMHIRFDATVNGLPWAFQFVWGPLIDRFQSSSMGRRKPWVVGSQLMAVLATLTLLLAVTIQHYRIAQKKLYTISYFVISVPPGIG